MHQFPRSIRLFRYDGSATQIQLGRGELLRTTSRTSLRNISTGSHSTPPSKAFARTHILTNGTSCCDKQTCASKARAMITGGWRPLMLLLLQQATIVCHTFPRFLGLKNGTIVGLSAFSTQSSSVVGMHMSTSLLS